MGIAELKPRQQRTSNKDFLSWPSLKTMGEEQE
jgi:hypothetical protein